MTLSSRTGRSLQVGATLALLLATSCAAIAKLEASKRVPATLADGVLTPGRPPAEKFGADPARTCPVGGVYDEVEARLQAAVKDLGALEIPADGRLCAVAEALLAWPSDEVPAHVRAFLGSYFGLVGGAPLVNLVTLESDDPRELGKALVTTIQGYGGRVTSPRYGLATSVLASKRGGDKAIQDSTTPKTRVVIALYGEAVQVEPLPRRLEPGQKVEVSGTLTGDLENARLFLSDAQGRLSEPPATPGKAFKATVACEDRPGRIVVEVRGEEMGNDRVIGTIPLACGGPALARTVPVAPPAAWPADPDVQEKKMMEAVDAERAAAGLPRLTWPPALGQIARDVSVSLLARTKKGAAVENVNVSRRLQDADVDARDVKQNPSAAWSGEVAFDRLMSSPASRADAMSPALTHAGLGVALGVDATGKAPLVVVTQLFVLVAPPPDVEASKKAIRESIDQKRAAEKLGPLTSDPLLEKLAGEYAAVVAGAGGPPPKAKTEELVKTLKQTFKDTVFMVDARLDLADFAEDPNALAKGKLVGLGGALGRHPRLGKNTLFVVLIIANKLPGKK